MASVLPLPHTFSPLHPHSQTSPVTLFTGQQSATVPANRLLPGELDRFQLLRLQTLNVTALIFWVAASRRSSMSGQLRLETIHLTRGKKDDFAEESYIAAPLFLSSSFWRAPHLSYS